MIQGIDVNLTIPAPTTGLLWLLFLLWALGTVVFLLWLTSVAYLSGPRKQELIRQLVAKYGAGQTWFLLATVGALAWPWLLGAHLADKARSRWRRWRRRKK